MKHFFSKGPFNNQANVKRTLKRKCVLSVPYTQSFLSQKDHFNERNQTNSINKNQNTTRDFNYHSTSLKG